SGQYLTIGAVADTDRVGIDLRFVGDLSAVASAVDFHEEFLHLVMLRRETVERQPSKAREKSPIRRRHRRDAGTPPELCTASNLKRLGDAAAAVSKFERN